MKAIFTALMAISLTVTLAWADSKLGLNLSTNVSKPEVWKDQLGGHATPGSMFVRTPTQNLQLMTVDMPSFSAGCGGIDLYGGGLGYMNGAMFKDLLKNIGGNAISYGAMLAIKTISPQISDLLDQLESMSRFINSQNINSCQAGAAIASGLFPKTEASQRLACQSRKMGSDVGNKMADYFTSRYDCSDEDKMKATNKEDKEGLLPREYNLVWFALKDSELSQAEKELLMSISGTVISKDSDAGQLGFTHKQSLVKDQKLLEDMLMGKEGGTIKVYKCDEKDKCLTVKIGERTLTKEDSILYKVSTLIDGIAQKFYDEAKGVAVSLSKEEQYFASSVSLPVIQLIALKVSLKGDAVKHTIDDFAEAIAFEYLLGYFQSLLDITYQAVGDLEHSQIEGDTIKNFKDEVKEVRRLLRDENDKAYQRLNTLLAVQRQTLQLTNMTQEVFQNYRSIGR